MRKTVCTWCKGAEILAILEKDNCNYFLDGQVINYELGRKLQSYNYCNMRKEIEKLEKKNTD